VRTILHIDFNSYFATVEQQANPRLRGKPIGVTGGDRMKRTVIGAASIEAKEFGVKTGMPIWEALKLCPQIILVKGDSDKYLETTKRFLNILKNYGPNLEVFSIDEVFLEVTGSRPSALRPLRLEEQQATVELAQEIKKRIKTEIGEWMRCSIGISYNKLMAKLAGSLQKPDGLILIPDQQEAMKVLDKVELDDICGIGGRIKKRLFNMGITNFSNLRKASKENLTASFKSYGLVLWKMARGLDDNPIIPFYEKMEVKSIGHRHTIDHDTNNLIEIKQILLKLTELIARRLRSKKLVGKTVNFGLRYHDFSGTEMQTTIPYTSDGLEIFRAAWKIFNKVWSGEKIRMVGISISNLKPFYPQTLSLLPETSKRETMLRVIDKINDKFGEFTLQRGILLQSAKISRKPNPFLADRRFKI